MFWKKSKLLILYSTIDGHTKDICEYIYKKLNGKKKVKIISIEESGNYDLSDWLRISVGNEKENNMFLNVLPQAIEIMDKQSKRSELL